MEANSTETYSDEYIDYWAEKYIGYGIQFLSTGNGEPITFGDFIQHPFVYLDVLLQGLGIPVDAGHIEQLLRADRSAQMMREEIEQLESEGDEVCRPIRLRGRRLIQRLNPLLPPKLAKCGGHNVRAKPCA